MALPETYSYDAEGNRLVSHLSAAHTTDDGNRLLQDDTFDYTYDDNGNLATRTDRATLGVTSYSYDAQDQLIRIDFPDTTFATYAYDALGRRIAKDVDDGAGGREVTAYVYDGADILMEFDGTGGFLARYAHGDRVDQPLAMTRAGQDYYIQADHQGSVIRVTDSAGAVVNSYEYDAYGQRLTATEGVEIAFGYTGREYDAESGLMYYRARVYDPSSGRFLQTDPLGFAAGDANLYRYVGNNPVNFTDPSGLFLFSCDGCGTSSSNGVSPISEAAIGITARGAAEGIVSEAVRDSYSKQVAELDPEDSAGRGDAKSRARDQTPRGMKDVIESARPDVGPREGTGGTANRTNSAVNRVAKIAGALGRASGVTAVIIGTYEVATSPAPYRAAAQVVGATVYGAVGGIAGAAGGTLVNPGVGTVVGAIALAGAGGYLGGEVAGEFFDRAFCGKR